MEVTVFATNVRTFGRLQSKYPIANVRIHEEGIRRTDVAYRDYRVHLERLVCVSRWLILEQSIETNI